MELAGATVALASGVAGAAAAQDDGDGDHVESHETVVERRPYQRLTRDEIARAKYDTAFDDLSDETTWEIEELYDRHPFAIDLDPEDVLTRDEIGREKYNTAFDDLSDRTTWAVEDLYDNQFARQPRGSEYTREEIARAKYDTSFDDLSDRTTWIVEEFYDRQPFVNVDVGDLRTRDEIAQAEHGLDFEELSDETTWEIEALFDAQFARHGRAVAYLWTPPDPNEEIEVGDEYIVVEDLGTQEIECGGEIEVRQWDISPVTDSPDVFVPTASTLFDPGEIDVRFRVVAVFEGCEIDGVPGHRVEITRTADQPDPI